MEPGIYLTVLDPTQPRRGIDVKPLDMHKRWTFHPAREFTLGSIITGGDIFGMVEENELINHAIMFFPGKSGRITASLPPSPQGPSMSLLRAALQPAPLFASLAALEAAVSNHSCRLAGQAMQPHIAFRDPSPLLAACATAPDTGGASCSGSPRSASTPSRLT